MIVLIKKTLDSWVKTSSGHSKPEGQGYAVHIYLIFHVRWKTYDIVWQSKSSVRWQISFQQGTPLIYAVIFMARIKPVFNSVFLLWASGTNNTFAGSQQNFNVDTVEKYKTKEKNGAIGHSRRKAHGVMFRWTFLHFSGMLMLPTFILREQNHLYDTKSKEKNVYS